MAHAGLFSLLAPCLGIALYLVGWHALRESPVGMPVLGAVSLLIIGGGLIFGVFAFFSPTAEGTTRKALAGVCINGLVILFAILSLFTRQKVAAKENKPPEPPHRARIYMSGR
jgi:hypothetical protein